MEEGNTDIGNQAIYESDQMNPSDCSRIKEVLNKIVEEGRITALSNDTFTKVLDSLTF